MSFRVDGCGTHSVNKILKYIGDYKCDNCKTVHAFYLYEMTEKITVLYVPVARISKRYAALCEKCKKGYKITEEQKLQLLAGNNKVMSSFFTAEESGTINTPQSPAIRPENNTGSAEQVYGGFCAKCGTPVDSSARFCCKCGRQYTEEEIAIAKAAAAGIPMVCNKCGNAITDDMVFCIKCGNKLV